MGVFYDEERIMADADTVQVAEYIGLEMRRAAGKWQIKCPGHPKILGKEDNNFGSCVLVDDPAKSMKGYHCFACGRFVNLIGMVREVKDCSYIEALREIGEANGGSEQYVIDGTEDFKVKKESLFSNEDLELIGLIPSIAIKLPMNYSDTRFEVLEEKIDDNINMFITNGLTRFRSSISTVYPENIVYTAKKGEVFEKEDEFGDWYRTTINGLTCIANKKCVKLLTGKDLISHIKSELKTFLNCDEKIISDYMKENMLQDDDLTSRSCLNQITVGIVQKDFIKPKKKKCILNDYNSHGCLIGYTENISMRQLYKENEELYYEIIRNKALEKADVCQSCIDTCDALASNNGLFLRNSFMELKLRCLEIASRAKYTLPDVQEELKTFTKKKKKINSF